MANLEGRSALVTGASQGIGRACALDLARQGASLWLAARNEDALRSVADEIASAGGKAQVTRLDVSDAQSITDGLAPVLADGGVDVLVNNAGVTDDGLFIRMKDEQWQRVLDTNLTGTMRVTRTLLKPMMKKRWGRIVLVSSVAADNACRAFHPAGRIFPVFARIWPSIAPRCGDSTTWSAPFLRN